MKKTEGSVLAVNSRSECRVAVRIRAKLAPFYGPSLNCLDVHHD
jgi:hypothetical protein